MSTAHSRGPAGPVVHRSHSSRLAEREGLGSFGDDCGLSQSSGREMERDSELVNRVESTDSECLRSVATDGLATWKDSAGRASE